MNAATPADDSFHEPADPDPFWTETAWFGFSAPERKLSGAIYPVFRPNQNICSAAVYVWDDTGVAQHEILYARNWWHLQMPDHDLTKMSLPIGLRYETVEPLSRYRIRFDDPDGELVLDLTYTGLHDPHAPMVGPTGHLDQACRVEGSLTLRGEDIQINGFEMRDRSWSVRKDNGQVRAGYDYGIAGQESAFLAMSIGGGDTQPVISGFRLINGEHRTVTGGTRMVERVKARPTAVRLDLNDDAGQSFTVSGRPVNHFALQSSPNYFAWMSLAQWSLDDTSLWGQSQDVWSPDLLRAEILGGKR